MSETSDKETRDSSPDGADASAAEDVFRDHAMDLKRFLLGLLRDDASADDALQATFASLLESGRTIQGDGLRAWLFKVGYNQAMLMRRQAAVQSKHAGEVWRVKRKSEVDPSASLEQRETAARVNRAVGELSEDQRVLVMTRMHGDLKFREIAESLKCSLGYRAKSHAVGSEYIEKQVEW